MQDHLFSLYLPWSDIPIYETLIDGYLWDSMQITSIFCGLAFLSWSFDRWEDYRERTKPKRRPLDDI
jgi:hypothetical protein